MQLCDIFLRLGEDNFQQLMRSVSMGRLKTYQLFDRFKTRLHLHKLNSETLRKATPRIWARLGERDDEFATDLAQAILVSHLDMIRRCWIIWACRTRTVSSPRTPTSPSI